MEPLVQQSMDAPMHGLPRLSALGQIWRMPDSEAAAHRQGLALAQMTGLPAVVARILAGRGHAAPTLANAFLNPRLDMLPDPGSLKDMDAAVERLAAAIRGSRQVAIFGDYDVDGTCASALLSRYLKAVGVDAHVYIPDRLTEGYGPTPEAMRALAERGTHLLVTVDTGTTAFEALEEARKLGMQVIVTDHHLPQGSLPPADALVNPQRYDDTSELQGLCGSGVVFYLLLALNRRLRADGFFEDKAEPNLAQYLDLVALATVADVMHLTGVNRVLVAKGLQQLGTWRHRGLAALAGVAGVRDDVSATGLGFSLAPRLNAAGRVDSAHAALNLLLAETDEVALPLAQHLDGLNKQRQALEKQILQEAMEQAEAHMNDDTLALVLHADGWHPGVVGIVASRVKERFNRPAFILGCDENGLLKGSGRGITGFNLGEALHVCKDQGLLLSGGGHAMAAGVTLEKGKLAAFREALNAAMWEQLNGRADGRDWPLSHRLAPVLALDAEVSAPGLTAALAQTLQQLAPFGMGNPEPVLALPGTRIRFSKTVGADQSHLRVSLADSAGRPGPDAICFGAMNTPLGPLLANSAGRALTLAVTAKPRTFNGKAMLDVHVKDAMAA